MLSKSKKLDLLLSLYNKEVGDTECFEFDARWPTFLSDISPLDFSNSQKAKLAFHSFYSLITAFEDYYTHEADSYSGFGTTLEKIRGIDFKVSDRLRIFEGSGSHCDHTLLDSLIQNYLSIFALLRKVTVKCFGSGSNSASLRRLLDQR